MWRWGCGDNGDMWERLMVCDVGRGIWGVDWDAVDMGRW